MRLLAQHVTLVNTLRDRSKLPVELNMGMARLLNIQIEAIYVEHLENPRGFGLENAWGLLILMNSKLLDMKPYSLQDFKRDWRRNMKDSFPPHLSVALQDWAVPIKIASVAFTVLRSAAIAVEVSPSSFKRLSSLLFNVAGEIFDEVSESELCYTNSTMERLDALLSLLYVYASTADRRETDFSDYLDALLANNVMLTGEEVKFLEARFTSQPIWNSSEAVCDLEPETPELLDLATAQFWGRVGSPTVDGKDLIE
jgi:hypothetical protein